MIKIIEDKHNHVSCISNGLIVLGNGAYAQNWSVVYLDREIKRKFPSRNSALRHLEYLIEGYTQPEWI